MARHPNALAAYAKPDTIHKPAPVTLPRVSLQDRAKTMPDLNAGSGIGKAGSRPPHALKAHNPAATTPHPRVVDDRGEQLDYGARPTRDLTRGGKPV